MGSNPNIGVEVLAILVPPKYCSAPAPDRWAAFWSPALRAPQCPCQPWTCLYRSHPTRPRAQQFRTDCRVLIWMAGQAQQSGSVARYRQFEPTRFESAPPFSQFIMKHFQDARVTSFRENFSKESPGICCVRRAACMFRDTASSIHCHIDCWKEQRTPAQSGPKGSSNVVTNLHCVFS